MAALQGTFTHPKSHAVMPLAYLVLDDVVVSLQSQIAAIHYSIYYDSAAHGGGADPVYSDHTEAMSPNFASIDLGAIGTGSLDAQIRQAAYQWLLTLVPFAGWSLVA